VERNNCRFAIGVQPMNDKVILFFGNIIFSITVTSMIWAAAWWIALFIIKMIEWWKEDK
jgi:uncharacterized membrane protein